MRTTMATQPAGPPGLHRATTTATAAATTTATTASRNRERIAPAAACRATGSRAGCPAPGTCDAMPRVVVAAQRLIDPAPFVISARALTKRYRMGEVDVVALRGV